MIAHRVNWGIVGWLVGIVLLVAAITICMIAVLSSTDDCTASGGREVYQYSELVGKIIVPVYACEHS